MSISSATNIIFAAGERFVIVLDAGHGGKDPGAVGSSKVNREKDINLDIVKEVGRLLQTNCPDVKLIYTRQTDVFVELGRRAEIANRAKADLFVSVHVNALPRNAKKVTGVQSYTLALKTASTNLEVEKAENAVIEIYENGSSRYNYNNPKSAESDIMFEIMQDEHMKNSVDFAKIVQREMVSYAGRHDMGVQQANLAVLRLTYMPSVLLEVGYISTPSEEQFLMSQQGRKSMARSIYNAIVKYKARQTGSSGAPLLPRENAIRQDNTANNGIYPVTNDQKLREQVPVQQQSESNLSQQITNQQEIQQQSGQEIPQQTITNSDSGELSANSPVTTPKYHIQILACATQIKNNDPQLKGVSPVDVRKDKGLWKYSYGSVATMEDARKLRKNILSKFPQAFIVRY